MKLQKVLLNSGYRRWCRAYVSEQNETTRMLRKFLKNSKIFNPYDTSRELDNILRRYERNLYG